MTPKAPVTIHHNLRLQLLKTTINFAHQLLSEMQQDTLPPCDNFTKEMARVTTQLIACLDFTNTIMTPGSKLDPTPAATKPHFSDPADTPEPTSPPPMFFKTSP